MSNTPRTDTIVHAPKSNLMHSNVYNANIAALIHIARTLETERNAFGLEANRLSAENARLRAALERLAGRMDAFVSHGLDAKQRQVEHWSKAARAALAG